MIQYDKFQLSLKRLAEQYENHQHGGPERSNLDREGIAESVIQRFETCDDFIDDAIGLYQTMTGMTWT